MSDWRWNRGWSDRETGQRLERVDPSRRNFTPDDPMRPEQGWNHVLSQAVIARESAGLPVPGGRFERARRLVEQLEFSDPRIVVAHFDSRRPLRGRPVLLELQALGLRFLSPVVIAEVRDDPLAFGLCFETLEGHIERGRECFLLTKNPDTGLIRFRIEASWRDGEFPGRWAWLGFQLVGRRYQRAWHRLAHLRLRRLLAAGTDRAAGERLAHGGPRLAAEAVFFHSRPGRRGAGTRVEREYESVSRTRWLQTTAWGLLAGARSMTPPAMLGKTLAADGATGAGRLLTHPGARRVFPLLAAAELVADKAPRTPARVQAPSLVARAASGALAGAALRGPDARRSGSMALGAATALAATYASWKLRARLADRVGEPLAALVEDGLVLGAGAALLAGTRRRAPSGLADARRP